MAGLALSNIVYEKDAMKTTTTEAPLQFWLKQ